MLQVQFNSLVPINGIILTGNSNIYGIFMEAIKIAVYLQFKANGQ